MEKNFVLDTNVLLHDPEAIFAFADNQVILPIYVIEEIDKFKRDASELGRAARAISRSLDSIRKQGRISEGVLLENGGTLRVGFTSEALPAEMAVAGNEMDSRIIAVALATKEKEPDRPCILVSKDVNLRIRADALGLRAEDYETERADIEELWPGRRLVEVKPELIRRLRAEQSLVLPFESEAPNEFMVLDSSEGTALARVSPDQSSLRLVSEASPTWGITPRNLEQSMAMELLLDDEVQLVSLVGKAGTGKTLLAIAAGLQRTAEQQVYQRVLVSRPIFPMGKDLGYLPGTVEEKMGPWMQPIFDNVEFLMGLSDSAKPKNGRAKSRSYRELIDLDLLQVEPLTYIRGRSIPEQYMIVDEAQNLTPHEVKTILTRAGTGTKIVLTGDPYQIDNPYMDASNNGLVYVVKRMKGERISGHVTLIKGERSALAELAANRL
ncbi:MAG: PhoH family protein [Myxococcota bacterium]